MSPFEKSTFTAKFQLFAEFFLVLGTPPTFGIRAGWWRLVCTSVGYRLAYIHFLSGYIDWYHMNSIIIWHNHIALKLFVHSNVRHYISGYVAKVDVKQSISYINSLAWLLDDLSGILFL